MRESFCGVRRSRGRVQFFGYGNFPFLVSISGVELIVLNCARSNSLQESFRLFRGFFHQIAELWPRRLQVGR